MSVHCLSTESAIPQTRVQSFTGLLETLDKHRPYLSPASFDDFTERTIDYLGQFPTEEANQEGSDVETSRYSGYETAWVARNESLRVDGQLGIDELREPLSRRIKEEFRASRRASEPNPELDSAVSQLEAVLAQTKAELDDKSERYNLLLEYSASRTDIAAEELSERMTEALVDMSDTVLASPLMPEPPSGRFKRKEKESIYRSWEQSKAKMLANLALPDRHTILTDYYRSADASFRRSLYGSRKLILDRGRDSDSTEEIDSFQKRFYEQLGGYRIALTPREWATQHLSEFVDWLLYSPDSETAKLLDESDQQNQYPFSSRNFRRGKYRHEDYGQKDRKETTFSAASYATTPNQSRETNEDPEEGLDDEQKEVFRDMQLLVDSRLVNGPDVRPGLKLSKEDRAKVILLCSNIIKTTNLNVKKFAPASDELRRRIISRMIAQVHPDNANGGDEVLCKIVTDLQTRLKTETN